ncbi:small heat shock protein [Coprinopsis cinerea okayama7|uniref:Small heat shock protein n=1 Tax=Coprinopsis cinerea (strain Okayama-7 / 130 / ATCC MYA-4618 / FGSC 9003) TaxID=240176 RepID=A8N7T4_COPC7|nr:small heat shock protein [Coprinopsis cinerea okayama7\|eukprot:XP_001830890.1 small heat shock protein [Coprinopsis cinerea okayama7\
MSNVFFYEPFYDFDRFFDEAFNFRNFRSGETGTQLQRRQSATNGDGAIRYFKPRMDLHEDKEKNLVTATFELPGLKKEDISIDVQNGRLTVSAESKSSSEHNENGYAVRERRFGKFSRTLQLPEGLKDDTIKASMQDGVLTVTFPKTSPELAPKKIAIN